MSTSKLVVALVLVGGSAVASWRLHAPLPLAAARIVATIPTELRGWTSSEVPLDERQYRLLESRDVLLRRFERSGDSLLACIAVAGPEAKAAHPPEICYRGQGWRIESQSSFDVALAGRVRPLCELVIAKDGERQLVWSWYRVGDEETESWWREQWLALAARLADRVDPAALLRFSTPLLQGDAVDAAARLDAARRRLAGFLELFLPATDGALAAAASRRESRPP